jgi:hypothetical protein
MFASVGPAVNYTRPARHVPADTMVEQLLFASAFTLHSCAGTMMRLKAFSCFLAIVLPGKLLVNQFME